MAISAVKSTMQAQTSSATTANAVSLNGDTFMKLFTQEISNQNPMEPMQSSEFLNQFAQVTSVQTMGALQTTMAGLSSTLKSMLSSQQQSTAAGLVGRQITYSSSTGSKQGTVDSVRINPGLAPTLILKDGASITLDSLQQVS
ncbi:MAG: flagellar hook capping FlgD N-terminal domain-containing protein [Planctomycetota bacterium]